MIAKEDYAFLSAFVYNNKRGLRNIIELIPSWTDLGNNSNLSDSGFTAQAFRNGNEIVIAFKGTDFLIGTDNAETLADLRNDLLLGAGFGADQLIEAVHFYSDIYNQYGENAHITFTGHSLGAGLASIMSVWFDKDATVFADAPFQISSVNLSLIKAISESDWINPILAADMQRLLIVQNNSGGITQPTQSLFLDQAEYDSRESHVTSYYVDGEVLNAVFGGFSTIVGNNIPIEVGGGSAVSAVTLHSMNLHAALLMDAQFKQDTFKLPALLSSVFDQGLYAVPLQDPDRVDFLTHLVKDQFNNGYSASNGLLHQFALDVSRLDINLVTDRPQLQKALIAAAIEGYYFMSSGFAKPLFTSTGGFISFDLKDIGQGAEKSAPLLLETIRNLAGEDFDLMQIDNLNTFQVAIGNLSDRVIAATQLFALGMDEDDMVAGSSASDILYGGKGTDWLNGGDENDQIFGGDGRDILLGGDGSDHLYGGLGDDLINGLDQLNESPDILEGGAGLDTYYAGNSDTVIDSDSAGRIFFRGLQLTGGYLSESGEYYIDANNSSITYRVANDSIRAQYGNESVIIQAENYASMGIIFTEKPFINRINSIELAASYSDPNLRGDDTYYYNPTTSVAFYTIIHDLYSAYTVNPDGNGPDIYRGVNNNSLFIEGESTDALIVYKENPDSQQTNFNNYTISIGEGMGAVSFEVSDQSLFTITFSDGITWNSSFIQQAVKGYAGTVSDDSIHSISLTPAYLYGFGGNDRLEGGPSDDILDGGQGNDVLIGEGGNDTYIFGYGYGQDTIYVCAEDALKFDHSVEMNDLEFTRDNENLYIKLKGSTDRISLVNQYQTFQTNAHSYTALSSNAITKVEFANGVILDLSTQDAHFVMDSGVLNGLLIGTSKDDVMLVNGVIQQASLSGYDGNDVLTAGVGQDSLYGGSGDDTLYGEGGNDSLNGEDGEDILYGGTGSDDLYGGNDDDILDGGSGADRLMGGSGSDSYQFGFGYGYDTIVDGEGNNQIQLIDIDISSISYSLSPTGYLVLGLNNNDRLTVESPLGNFSLSSGSGVVEAAELQARYMSFFGQGQEQADFKLELLEDQAYTIPLAYLLGYGPGYSYLVTMENGSLLPSWIQVDNDKQLISLLPDNSAVGEESYKLSVVDGLGTIVSDYIIDLNVANVNDLPVQSQALEHQVLSVGQHFNAQIPQNLFTDVDSGDRISYYVLNHDGQKIPDWLNFDARALTISGTPDANNIGELILKVIGKDRSGSSVATDWQFTINQQPINSALTIDVVAPQQNATVSSLFASIFFDSDSVEALNQSFNWSDVSTLTTWGNFDNVSFDSFLKMGALEQSALKDWYDISNNQFLLNLQAIAEEVQKFSFGDSDDLCIDKVESFNFANLLSAFDAAGATANWQLTDAQLTAHLSTGGDTAAIGDDIAYQYGKAGSLTGIGLLSAQAVLNNTNVGQSAQALSNSSNWAAETIKLS